MACVCRIMETESKYYADGEDSFGVLEMLAQAPLLHKKHVFLDWQLSLITLFYLVKLLQRYRRMTIRSLKL